MLNKEKVREVLQELYNHAYLDADNERAGVLPTDRRTIDDFVTSLESLLEQEQGGAKVTGETSDGYHTFNELYDHRIALFLYAIRHGALKRPYAVAEHFDGWDLIVAFTEDFDAQVSYHVPVKDRWLWTGYVPVKGDTSTSTGWDGHTSKDVVARLNLIPALPKTEGTK